MDKLSYVGAHGMCPLGVEHVAQMAGGYYIVSKADRLNGDQIKTLLFGREIAGVDLWNGDHWTQVRGLDGTATCTENADAEDHDLCVWRGPSADPGSGRG